MSAVFLKILNMSITASWLILAVIAVRLLLKKAPRWIACLLWGLVAFRLVCPFSLESVFSLIPSGETVPSDIALSPVPRIDSGVSVINETVNPVLAESFTPSPASGANPLQIVIPAAAIVWIAGMTALLAYALVSFLKLKKSVSASISVGERIMACDEVKTPFILGVFKPMIYVPSSLTGQKLDCVIRHEKAHLKRRDHLWKPLGFLLLSVYWFNPLCWAAYVLLCRDIEKACDEKVVRNMDRDEITAYSQALLDFGFSGNRIAACPLAFGEAGVKERVKGVLNYKKPAFWIILISVFVCIVLAVCLLTDPFSGRTLSGKLAVSMDTAIAEHHRSPALTEDLFEAVDYDVLKVSEKAGETTVYAWVLYEVFSFDGSDVKLESGSHVPTAITFDTSSDENDSSTYDVTEYWEPRDGSYYADDIRAKFPPGIWSKAFDVSGADRQHENCLKEARAYFLPDFSGETKPDLDELRKKYPEYFNLPSSKGLEVYVWQLAPDSYSCGLLPGTNRDKTDEELRGLRPVSIEEMKAILSTYDLPDSDIFITPLRQPYSDYLYTIDAAYAETLRAMFFPSGQDDAGETKPKVGNRILTTQFRFNGGDSYTVFVYNSGYLGFAKGKLTFISDRDPEEIGNMEDRMSVFRISPKAYEGLHEQISNLPGDLFAYNIFTNDSPYIVMETDNLYATFIYGVEEPPVIFNDTYTPGTTKKWNEITQTLCGILSECGLPQIEKDIFSRLAKAVPDPETFSEALIFPDETVLAYVFLEKQSIGGVKGKRRFTFYNNGTVCAEEGINLQYYFPFAMDDVLKKDVYPVDANRLDDLKKQISVLMEWYDGYSVGAGNFIKDIYAATDCSLVTVCTPRGGVRMYIIPPMHSDEVEFYKAVMTVLEICEDIPEENDTEYKRWYDRFSDLDVREWDLNHVAN